MGTDRAQAQGHRNGHEGGRGLGHSSTCDLPHWNFSIKALSSPLGAETVAGKGAGPKPICSHKPQGTRTSER